MKRALILTAFLGLLTTLLFSADITGKWTGLFVGGDQERHLTFDFAAKGETLSGTLSGVVDHPLDVKDGKSQADSVSFWILAEYQGQPVKLFFKGEVSGGEIHFRVANEEDSWSTEFVAKKSS